MPAGREADFFEKGESKEISFPIYSEIDIENYKIEINVARVVPGSSKIIVK